MTQQSGSTGGQAPPGRARVIVEEAPGTNRGSVERHDGSERTQPAYADRRHRAEPQMAERTTVIGRGSRLRGGPVLGGFVIGFATWILLELALFALDLGALTAQIVPAADSSTWWWSGLAALIGFFVGGLVAGASHPSRRVDDGVLGGIAMWAATVVALLVMSAIGAGIDFGVVGDVLATSSSLADADASVINDAQGASAGALLALSATLAAAAIGGALGSKMWPTERDGTIDLR